GCGRRGDHAVIGAGQSACEPASAGADGTRCPGPGDDAGGTSAVAIASAGIVAVVIVADQPADIALVASHDIAGRKYISDRAAVRTRKAAGAASGPDGDCSGGTGECGGAGRIECR